MTRTERAVGRRSDGRVLPEARLPRWVWAFVGVVSLVRLVVAARVPLTPDETYYWTWSLHPSFTYTDHPPMVAWLIAATSPFGAAPGVVRFPFVLCEAGTALALGEAAALVGGSGAAGAAAALAFSFIPQTKIALAEALPDAPYALFWALSLLLTLRLARRPSAAGAVALGAALGATVLSRFFGWALIAGIVAFALERKQRETARCVFLAVLVGVALYVPFLVADALHGWQNLAFTLVRRQTLHGAASTGADVSSLRFALYVGALWIVTIFVAIRPRRTLIAWTALPFATLLVALAPFESVEAYWLLGPYVSLCLGIGPAVARRPLGVRRLLGALAAIPALATTAIVGFWALAERPQTALLAALGPGAKGALYSSVFMFPALAADVRTHASSAGITPLSNRLEVLAELRYYGVAAAMIGEAPQEPQWNGWYDDAPAPPDEAVIVTYSPLVDDDAKLAARVARAYAHVGPSVPHVYAFAGTAAGTFYFTRCSGLRAGAAWP